MYNRVMNASSQPDLVNMSRRSTYGVRSPNVGYTKVNTRDDEMSYTQFQRPPDDEIPWRSLGFAAVLFVTGTILLTIGTLLLTGHIDEKYSDRTWPLLIFGSLMFIPGAYLMHIVCRVYFRYPGYSLDDIPQYD